MGLSGLSARYAVALYDLAETAGSLDAVADDLRSIQALLGESDDLRYMVSSQIIGRAAQGRAILAVLEKAGTSELVRKFVGVLAANGRLPALSAIIKAFLARLAEKRGEVVAEVTSAKALSKDQLAKVTEALKRSLGAKVLVDLKVDGGLIGGLVVKVGSRLVDSSIKTKLMRLQLAMKGTN